MPAFLDTAKPQKPKFTWFPAKCRDIGASINGDIWCVNKSGGVFEARKDSHSWFHKKNGGKYIAVAKDGRATFVNQQGLMEGFYADNYFDPFNGRVALDVGIGGLNDDLYYLDANNLLSENCWDVMRANGESMPGFGCGNRISVNANGYPVVVGGDERVYNWVGDLSGHWDALENMKAKDVAGGIDGSIYAIRKHDDEVMAWWADQKRWVHVGTTAKSIAVAESRLVIIDLHDNTFIAHP